MLSAKTQPAPWPWSVTTQRMLSNERIPECWLAMSLHDRCSRRRGFLSGCRMWSALTCALQLVLFCAAGSPACVSFNDWSAWKQQSTFSYYSKQYVRFCPGDSAPHDMQNQKLCISVTYVCSLIHIHNWKNGSCHEQHCFECKLSNTYNYLSWKCVRSFFLDHFGLNIEESVSSYISL